MPAPERFEAFFFICDRRRQALAAIIDALAAPAPERHAAQRDAHRQRLQGACRQRASIPWAETNGTTCRSTRRCAWIAFATTAGRRRLERVGRPLRHAGAGRARPSGCCAARSQGKVNRLQFVDDRLLAAA